MNSLNRDGEKKTIKVCDECGTPLIWTFFWDYNEYFCINCDNHWGMLGAGEDVEMTKELQKRQRDVNKIWKALAGYLIPRGRYERSGCKKCGIQDHNDHISKREKMANKIATKLLLSLEGTFLTPSNQLPKNL